MIGNTISHYRIVEKLGSGGMGVVYKAVDVRLNRFLALKILTQEHVTEDRKRRFFMEAKAASALNHPSIVHIYDIGKWEGADFIAMEYVEGDTLQQMLRKGWLPTSEALSYGIQIADAMSVAHAAGIVHRDLKPANVMVTSRGLVKILDFGVAKLSEPAPAVKALGTSPCVETQTMANAEHTMEGTIVGSPGYMSPEQATGQAVDARSDIFEFGVLLQEVLTGRPAFQGGTKLEVLSAILHVDPPKPSTINSAITPELEWVIAHCLRKDREHRFQSMAEVKIALEDLRKESSTSGIGASVLSATNVSASAVQPAAVPRNMPAWVRWAVIALALVFATTAGVFLPRYWKQVPSQKNSALAEVTRLTSEGGLCVDPAISPDGKLLAYASDRSGEGNLDIWLKQIGGGDAIRLTRHVADDVEPSFSPDGTRIVFRSTREGGGLYVIPTLGGEERKVADGGRQPRFSPDGTKLAYWTGPAEPNPLREGIAHAFILDLATSVTRRVRADFSASMQPVWSPDGSQILFLGLKDAKDKNTFDWWITPSDGGPVVLCHVLGPYALFTPFAWRGDRVYFTRNDQGRTTIGEVRIDIRTWQPIGAPRQLTSGTTDEYSPSISKDGSLVFSSISGNPDLYSLPLDANRCKVTGALQRLTREVADDTARSISGDGKKIAFTSDRTGITEIWVKDLSTGQERALTTGGADKTQAQISFDGRLVAWREDNVNKHQIFVSPFDGGLAVEVCGDCGIPTSWSPDGRFLLYQTRMSAQTLVGLLDVATGKKTDYLKSGDLKSADLHFGSGSISRDGKWMAFAAHRSLRDYTIYAAPFSPDRSPPPPAWIEITSAPAADPNPRWSPDGSVLYFSSEQDGYTCLWAQRLDPSTKRPRGGLSAVQHFHTPSLPMVAPSFWRQIALAADKVVVSLDERSGGVWMLKLQN